MNGEQARKRRPRAEIEQLVVEFVNSGMKRTEFCWSRGLALSTLDRHLRKQGKRKKRIAADSHLVAVELAGSRTTRENRAVCGLAVVLRGGRRIEVQRGSVPRQAPRSQRFSQWWKAAAG
jgi:hypothetical protein